MPVRREKRHPLPHHPRQWEGVGTMRRGGGGRTYVVRDVVDTDAARTQRAIRVAFRRIVVPTAVTISTYGHL